MTHILLLRSLEEHDSSTLDEDVRSFLVGYGLKHKLEYQIEKTRHTLYEHKHFGAVHYTVSLNGNKASVKIQDNKDLLFAASLMLIGYDEQAPHFLRLRENLEKMLEKYIVLSE